MSRHNRKTSAEFALEELVELSSLLPWWISIGSAVLLFFFVPVYMPGSEGSVSSSSLMRQMIWMMVGVFFKYFIPLGLLLGGLTNLFTRGRSAWMFKSINSGGARALLQQLSWKDFEFLVSEHFKKQGYSTDLVNAQGADGGVDIRVYKEGHLYLVQCKHYKAWKVSVQTVRELYGVMTAEGAVGGFIVTTGRFTKDAHSFATGKPIELIDGLKLEQILDNLSMSTNSDVPEITDTCPRCKSKLVKRNGSRGEFLGCSSFPKCRYTQDL
jgi:restriction system protein